MTYFSGNGIKRKNMEEIMMELVSYKWGDNKNTTEQVAENIIKIVKGEKND